MPHHDATLGFVLGFVRDIVRRSQGGERAADNNVGRLSRFRGGAPWRYMYRELFPELRASRMVLWVRPRLESAQAAPRGRGRPAAAHAAGAPRAGGGSPA